AAQAGDGRRQHAGRRRGRARRDDHGHQRQRLAAHARRHVGLRGPGRGRALRDHVARPLSASLRAGRGGAAMRRLSPRGIDRLIMALLALMTVTWLLAVEGRQGFGRDEGQYFRAGERYWGWFEELGTNLRLGRPGQSFTPTGLDRFWFDNAPDHP